MSMSAYVGGAAILSGAAALAWFWASRQRRSAHLAHLRKPPDAPAEISVEATIEGCSRKALAYAIYRRLLETPLPGSTEDALFEKYSYVNLPPTLDRERIFDEHPNLMNDSRFLADLRRWIVRHGGKGDGSFFAMSTEVGAILVKQFEREAAEIVERAGNSKRSSKR